MLTESCGYLHRWSETLRRRFWGYGSTTEDDLLSRCRRLSAGDKVKVSVLECVGSINCLVLTVALEIGVPSDPFYQKLRIETLYPFTWFLFSPSPTLTPDSGFVRIGGVDPSFPHSRDPVHLCIELKREDGGGSPGKSPVVRCPLYSWWVFLGKGHRDSLTPWSLRSKSEDTTPLPPRLPSDNRIPVC